MDGWQQNDWFPYSKYFDKEFKNPDDEILYDEDKKFAFLRRLDKAMEEMKNLIKKTKWRNYEVSFPSRSPAAKNVIYWSLMKSDTSANENAWEK